MSNVPFKIIILTYNAERYIEKLLDTLRPILDKTIIIDSSSQDSTLSLVAQYQINHLEIIPTESFDHGGTRSMVKKFLDADDQYAVFLTQDALPVSCDDVFSLLSAFENTSVGAAYGRQLPYEESTLFGKHLRLFNYPNESYIRTLIDKKQFGIKTAFLSNSFSAYRVSALNEINWFESRLILGEDVCASAKILMNGEGIAYVSNAECQHSHSYSIFEDFKRYFDIGVFHKTQPWLINEFGKPEGEGLRYIKSEFYFLCKNKAILDLIQFPFRNIAKYVGYRLGQAYQYLPYWFIVNISMHRRWWNAGNKN